MLSEYSRLLDCRRINLRIFLAFRILHQAFCAKSFGDSVRRIAGISKFVQYCTLTYSPWLKPGDSWIPTAFAYETIGLTMPLQRRSMPQPSRCSLQRSCPDHAQYRNVGTSTLGRANLSLRDSAHRRYDRSASLRSTGRPFGLLFPSYNRATGKPTTLVVPIKRGILWDDASLRETCGPQRRQRAAFAFAFVSLVYCIGQRGVKSRANLSPFWGTTYLENWIYRVVWGSPKRKISNAQEQTQKTGIKEWGHPLLREKT